MRKKWQLYISGKNELKEETVKNVTYIRKTF